MTIRHLQKKVRICCYALLLLGISMSGITPTNAQSCSTLNTGLNEIWFNHAGNGDIGSYNVITGVKTTYTTSDVLGFVTDIGYTPDGTAYLVASSGSGSTAVNRIYRVNFGSGTTYTTTQIYNELNTSTGAINALSFDANGNGYFGTGGNSKIYKFTISGNTVAVTEWADLSSGRSGGDFIFLNGAMYVLWNVAGSPTNAHLYRVNLTSSNGYGGFTDLGSITDRIGSAFVGYGMARVGDDLYIGGSNNNLYKVAQLTPTLAFAPIYTNNTQIYGLTSKVEALGDYANAPGITPYSRVIACGAADYRVDTIASTIPLPSGASLSWHTALPVSDANRITITAPTSLPVGAYYVAFRNNTINCYGPATAVTITNNSDCSTGTLTCSATSISQAPVVGIPSQHSLIVTINVTAPGTFPVSSLGGSGFSLANGIQSLSASSTGSQQFVIPVNYDGSALSTLTFNIGNAGNCEADLSSTAPKKVISEIWTLDNCTSVQLGPVLK